MRRPTTAPVAKAAAGCALLLAGPAASFTTTTTTATTHQRRTVGVQAGLRRNSNRNRNRHAPAPLRASMEVLDAMHGLGAHGVDGLAVHAAAAWDHSLASSWLDASSSVLADAAAALQLPDADGASAAVQEAASKAVADTSRSAGAIADEKALSEGGIHPWRAWRSLVQGSIVATHDFLYYTCGIKENAYGFAIILFTIGLRLAVAPLTWVQYSSTERMKAMQPYMEQIKERYANDQQMQNIMTAKLYEDTNSNPLLGCLPAFLQIPVFIALYRSILNLANDKLLEEPFLFVPTLEGPTLTDKLQLPQGRGIDWLTTQWTGDGSTPSFLGGDLQPLLGWEDTAAYCALPLIIVATQYLTQALITPPVDESLDEKTKASQKRVQGILKYIPLSIGWFSLQVPSALCLYWFTSNIMSAVSTTSIRVS